jgi:hypothetical protein
MSMLNNLYNGINTELEEQANAILREGRRGVTALSEKKDYLTEEQLNLRQAREVLNTNGFPDPSIRQGLYRRSYNPMSNARPRRQWADQDNRFQA